MAKGKGKKLKDKGQTISQPDANRKMKKKKKKVKAIDTGPPVPVSQSDSPQAHSSPTDNSSEAASRGRKKAKEKLSCLSGFIFMCNAMTKRECFQYRVFGLPAWRKEDVKNVKKGMKLFLFDCDLKLLYGVYKATSHGQMNLETSAFGGRFPAQVSFAIYEECIPLPVSAFRLAIKDNYQGSKFKPELTRRQVRELIKLFRPFATQTAAPVAPMPQVAPLQAIRPPVMEDRFQSSVRLLPSHDLHLAGAPHGLVAPIVEPHPVQQIVQHELCGTAAAMGHVYPTMEHQGLQASNDPYYSQIWQDQYPRRCSIYRLPMQRQGEYDLQQDTVAGYYSTYPLPATSNGPPLVHLHGEREFVPQQHNIAGYYNTYPTPATSHGPVLVQPHGQVPIRPELPVRNVYSAPATSHGPPLEHPHGQVPGRPELPMGNVYRGLATSHGQPLLHPYGFVPRGPEPPTSDAPSSYSFFLQGPSRSTVEPLGR
ncbi:DCD (Development and Cell Death) domain protein [Actinidia rufa]|uniref:DCD (Development and Cell Death) domain protein n=1 Tax=Actinidia rufa TaxID=165716 RepID=A0A7J0H2J7_9ERIC|nr:DCD (Development and Cell Death) domain protein [Actinidia rufa]